MLRGSRRRNVGAGRVLQRRRRPCEYCEIKIKSSDCRILVEECSDVCLNSVDSNYSVLVLGFRIFNSDHYAKSGAPEVLTFKFQQFGQDSVFLQECDGRA